MKKLIPYRLMNGLGDDGGDSGGAGGLGDEGGAGDNTGGGSGDNSNSGTGGDAGFVGPAWAKDLKLSVEADILKDPALGPITDLNSLVKSYVHAQRKIGQKGVLIPTDNSPKEEWDTFWQKIGVPLEESKYQETVKLSTEEGLDAEFNKEFAKMAHELRVPPKQAEKLHKFFAEKSKASADKYLSESSTRIESELAKLEAEWGPEAYTQKIRQANDVLKEHVGPEFLTYLKDSGLGKNAQVIKAFTKLASQVLKEPELPSGTGGNGAMTYDDIQREINKAFNADDPYMKSTHPDHKRRVDEVQKLYAKLEKRPRN